MSLYRQYFTPEEIAMLDATPLDDLTSEINLLRVLLARLLEVSQRIHALALKQQAAMLAAFSATGCVIASLTRLQVRLHNPLDALWQAIAQGERLARQQRHVYSYLSSAAPVPPAPLPDFQ